MWCAFVVKCVMFCDVMLHVCTFLCAVVCYRMLSYVIVTYGLSVPPQQMRGTQQNMDTFFGIVISWSQKRTKNFSNSQRTKNKCEDSGS